jgi:ribosome biogenesis GTPase
MLAPTPDLNTALLDRYLVAARASGIDAMVIVNKMDLLTPELVDESLAPYRSMGLPSYRMSARDRQGIEPFLEAVAGKWVLLAGHSGVGKTTLVNDVDPGGTKPVGDVHEATGKGKHTTSSAVAHRLPEGTVLVDTAGIREFSLWNVGWREVFHAAEACRFPDCRHRGEPRCAVRQAVDREEIDAGRYQSYLTLLGESEE